MTEDYVIRTDGPDVVAHFQSDVMAAQARSVLIMAGVDPEKVGLTSLTETEMFRQLRNREVRVEDMTTRTFDNIYEQGKATVTELRRQLSELDVELGEVGVRSSRSHERLIPSIPVLRMDRNRLDALHFTKELRESRATIGNVFKGDYIGMDVRSQEGDDRLTKLQNALQKRAEKQRGEGHAR